MILPIETSCFDYGSVLEDTPGSAIKRWYVSRSETTFTDGGKAGFYREPIAAMTLLPSPVTKTPTNTMKIQYDFNIQRVDPFQP